jgi:tetratricopeptide (TPR) repeat protein
MKHAVRPGFPWFGSRVRGRASTCIALLSVLWLGSLSTPARAEPDDEARILFQAGVAATTANRLREARDYFRRSAALVEKPTTLFNLAVVEVRLGMGTEALNTIQAYERFATPDHDLRPKIAVLRSEAEALVRKQRDSGAMLGEIHDSLVLEGEAAALFEAGRQAYWAGRYADALEYFERAEKLSKRPELLYDIGAAADRLRDDERALSALEAFLEADPGSPRAALVRARVEVLRKVVSGRQVSRPPPPTPPVVVDDPGPPPPPEHSYKPWLLLGAGAASVGGAVGSYFYMKNREENRDICEEAEGNCTNLRLIERQRMMAIGMIGVFGAGGIALLASGTVLALRPQVQVGMAAAPGEVSLRLGGRF